MGLQIAKDIVPLALYWRPSTLKWAWPNLAGSERGRASAGIEAAHGLTNSRLPPRDKFYQSFLSLKLLSFLPPRCIGINESDREGLRTIIPSTN